MSKKEKFGKKAEMAGLETITEISDTPNIPLIEEEVLMGVGDEGKQEETAVEISKIPDRELFEMIYWSLQDLLHGGKPIVAPADVKKTYTGRVSKKMSSADKKANKEKLLAAGPYSKEQLEAMGRKSCLAYASALKLDKTLSFGLPTDVVVRNILKNQK